MRGRDGGGGVSENVGGCAYAAHTRGPTLTKVYHFRYVFFLLLFPTVKQVINDVSATLGTAGTQFKLV